MLESDQEMVQEEGDQTINNQIRELLQFTL